MSKLKQIITIILAFCFCCFIVSCSNVNDKTQSYWEQLIDEKLIEVKKNVLLKVSPEFQGELIIPENITAIGDEAAKGCGGLTGLTIGKNVKTIGDKAFYECTNLAGDLIIPNSVTSLGVAAFYGCSGIQSLTLSKSLKSIPAQAFYGCRSISNELVIPYNVRDIAERAFYECDALPKVYFGDNVRRIAAFSFFKCSSITEIHFPKPLADERIVISIGYSSFAECASVKDIYYPGPKERWEKISFGDFWDALIEDYTVHFADEASSAETTDLYEQ